MTPIAHRLGLYSIPLLASLALPVWAAGPVGLEYLTMGMNKSAIEQGDSSGAIKLLGRCVIERKIRGAILSTG